MQPERIVGIDLGGARGKTTAVVTMRCDRNESGTILAGNVMQVATRSASGPWTDEAIFRLLAGDAATTLVAIAAPLSLTTCAQCVLPVCPGVAACEVPATVAMRAASRGKRAYLPYLHRLCEIELLQKEAIEITHVGLATGPLAARGAHLARRLVTAGYQVGKSLIEVIPSASVGAIFGPKVAKGYKRDANPWVTRVNMLDRLGDLGFHATSGFGRDNALRNDHCFDALVAAYTGICFLRGEGAGPAGRDSPAAASSDGWIVVPNARVP